MGTATGSVDTRFLKAFVDGALHTLSVQCKLEAKAEKPFFKGQRPQSTFEIAGVIGLTSSAFQGTITLCFPEKTYLAIMGSMLGESFKEITAELQDGAAELLNIIFGAAKAALSKEGYSVQMALPTVVRGKALQTTHLGKEPVVVLPFSTPNGEFMIEILVGTKPQ